MSESQKHIHTQKRLWHGVNELTLSDGRALKICKNNKGKTTSYMIDIISLNSRSRRVYSIAWGWLIMALICSLATYIFIEFPNLLAGLDSLYSSGIIVIVAISAVVGFVLFWLASTRKQVFYTRHEKIPLVEIWVGQPCGKSFRAFVKLLKESIQQLQEKSSLTSEQQLTGEMKMLRRMVDKNVVKLDDYEKAKASLFKKF